MVEQETQYTKCFGQLETERWVLSMQKLKKTTATKKPKAFLNLKLMSSFAMKN